MKRKNNNKGKLVYNRKKKEIRTRYQKISFINQEIEVNIMQTIIMVKKTMIQFSNIIHRIIIIIVKMIIIGIMKIILIIKAIIMLKLVDQIQIITNTIITNNIIILNKIINL